MKYAILGDIHANLEALQAVLEDAGKEKVTHYACIGDVVGYAANPKECLDIVRKLDCPIVKGNHDEMAASSEDPVYFHPDASRAIKWTREQLSEENRHWLDNMKMVRYVEGFTMVHASLDAPGKWTYVLDKLTAAFSLNQQRTAVCFHGHTHRPCVFTRDGSAVKGSLFERIHVNPSLRYFINVGSIGQPRDGNPLAAYVIYNVWDEEIILKRLPYDIRKAQEKIMAAGLPQKCATRLAVAK